MKKHRHTSGFTLVELSIVLVIIGLIVGGVLSGRQLMQNAQVTNATNAIQAYIAQFQTYVQNYGAMPGDDSKALAHFPDAGIPSAAETTSGTLDGAFDSALNTAETRLVWADLRAAGLVKGAGSDITQPSNPFGGIYGFQHGAFSGDHMLTTNVLCLSGVPGDAALSIDSRLDDGASDTGSVMSMISTGTAGETTDGAVADSYTSTNTYNMCVRM